MPAHSLFSDRNHACTESVFGQDKKTGQITPGHTLFYDRFVTNFILLLGTKVPRR